MKRTKLRKLIAIGTVGATLVSLAQPMTVKALTVDSTQGVEKTESATLEIARFPIDDLRYDVYSDGTAVVCGESSEGNPTDLVIPDTITAPTNTGKYTVVGIKDNAFQGNFVLKSVKLPNTLKSLGTESFAHCGCITSMTLPSALESIGDNCFQGCGALQGIEIPNSVKSLGTSVFLDCINLKTVSLSDILTSIPTSTFLGCEKLTDVKIPNSVTVIGGGSFEGCKSLASVTLPNKLTDIAINGFKGCSVLNSIELPSSLKCIGNCAFMSAGLTSIVVPEGVTDIRDSAFSANPELNEVSFPSTIKVVPPSAFENDSKLAKVTLSNDTQTLSVNSFKNCKSLPSITLPDSITGIGDSAFYGCLNLDSITIPDDVKVLNDSVFDHCSKLNKVTLPKNLEYIGTAAFQDCKALTNINLPISLATLKYGCFSNSGLTELTIPEKVKNIPSFAFSNCINLKTVALGNVDSVDTDGFSGCTSLISIDLSNVKSIGDNSFNKCSGLTKISLNQNGVVIGKNAFSACVNLPIKIEGQNIYRIETNGEATILSQVKTSTSTIATVTIPSKVGTNTVTGIAPVTLNDDLTQQNVTNINLPDTIKTIGDNAYARASNSTPVALPKSIESVGKNAFNSNTDLTFNNYRYRLINNALTLVGYLGAVHGGFFGVNSIGNMSIGEGALSNNKEITEITIPSNFSTIEKNAFSYCSNLAKVTIPSTVKTVASGVFVGTKISSVNLQEETAIKPDSFNSDTEITCKKFKYIIVKGSITITGYNGPDDDAIKIPSAINGLPVTSIGANVFKDNQKITDLILSDGITTIEDSAFAGCINLVRITIPESLVSVGLSAFADSSKIVSINFLHTRDLISVQENSFNKSTILSFKPKTFTVNFKNSDGTVLSTQIIDEAKGATEPTKPTKDDFTFKGWDKAFTNITADIVINAVFEKNPEIYNVTFKDSDGKILSSLKVESGKSAAAPVNPTKAGNNFKSWDKAFESITSDLVITATYTVNTYKVVFKNSDGSVISESTVEYGKDAKSPEAPVKDGFTFTGWSKPITSISADTEVVATYSAKEVPTADTSNLFGLLALVSTSLGGLISGLKKIR